MFDRLVVAPQLDEVHHDGFVQVVQRVTAADFLEIFVLDQQQIAQGVENVEQLRNESVAELPDALAVLVDVADRNHCTAGGEKRGKLRIRT